jgi:anti-sigma factor RsiW
MKCRRCRQSFSALLDGELSPAERAGVEAHLASCAACATGLAQLRRALAQLDQHQDLELSPDFEAGFQRKLARAGQQDQDRSSRRRWWRIPALGLAAAAAAAAIVLLVVHRDQPTPRAPSRIALADIALASRLELLRDYEVISNLDGLENFTVVSQLHELLEEESP